MTRPNRSMIREDYLPGRSYKNDSDFLNSSTERFTRSKSESNFEQTATERDEFSASAFSRAASSDWIAAVVSTAHAVVERASSAVDRAVGRSINRNEIEITEQATTHETAQYTRVLCKFKDTSSEVLIAHLLCITGSIGYHR